MGSNNEIFEQVRAAVDIVEVIGEHVALKKAGREFKGLCPFHPDHRPSMAVVPHKQIFHCFVCGTGGDVFKFVKEFHKMGNGEALRMLAQRAGIKLPELPRSGGRGPEKGEDGLSARERIAATNEWACGFFEKYLRTPLGKLGLDYFHSRGLTDETIGKFRLGMSPGWTTLVNAAAKLSIASEKLLEAGLVKQRQDSSLYDAFHGRVIFPIIDASGGGGRLIAFGGRVLEEKRDEQGNVVEAKYINSPDSKLFNKSESLYGLNLARQQIIRTRTAIVVEGYMDVIACHQAGVTNVIATLGTALTLGHARILKNYAQNIVLVFDSDDAGRRATDRALEVFVRGSLDIRLASVPDGKDPCDFCMKNGGEAFQKVVDNSTDALTHKWRTLQQQFHGTESLTARQEMVTTYLRFVAAAMESSATGMAPAMDPVRRGLLLAKIAGLVSMPVPELQATLKRLAKLDGGGTGGGGGMRSTMGGRTRGQIGTVPAAIQGAASHLNAGDGETIETVAAEADAADLASEPARPVRVDIRTLKGLAAAEGWLLGALLVRPVLYERVREQLSLTLFETFQPLALKLLEYFDNQSELERCSLAEITSAVENDELSRQAIALEDKTADWLEPASLSPQHTKMLKHLTADRGLSLESLVGDSLRELCAARPLTDPNVEAEFSDGIEGAAAAEPAESEDAAAFKEIAAIQSRNNSGGNRRVIG